MMGRDGAEPAEGSGCIWCTCYDDGCSFFLV